MILNRVIIIVFVLFVFSGCSQAYEQTVIKNVCAQSKCIQVEIADTPTKTMQGLMYRESMDANNGMLFLFSDSQQRTFWMKNTLIPLDIVWIDNQQRIVGVAQNVSPCQADPCPHYPSVQNVQYVLEVNAGIINQLQWQIGEQLEFE